MTRSTIAGAVLGVLGLAISATATAGGVTVGATGVTSPQGDFGGDNPLVNIINQSSLSSSYVSGSTDFDAFVAGTSAGGLSGSGFTGTESNGPQQFSFDLGALFSIDGIAVWNSGSVGSITRFELYADNDADFSNGTTALILGASALSTATPSIADVFSFASIQTRFIHFNGLASLEPPDFYGLNEVVFRGTTVPEPGSLALLLLGVAGLGTFRRSK